MVKQIAFSEGEIDEQEAKIVLTPGIIWGKSVQTSITLFFFIILLTHVHKIDLLKMDVERESVGISLEEDMISFASLCISRFFSLSFLYFYSVLFLLAEL